VRIIYTIIILLCGNLLLAQYNFNGYVNTERWQGDVYLSIIEDYRTLQNINSEQIISKITPDASGYFQFSGDQLDNTYKIYKIHVDNCTPETAEANHFDGHCSDSKEILFIAKNTDSIRFPLSFDAEMFCDIEASNEKAGIFIKIDSLIGEMRFDYSEFRSKANRELNNKKWFKALQEFGKDLNEPLAELYIYAFLSERGSSLHQYYLEDLKTNNYYNEMLGRLNTSYPNSTYLNQYEGEIASDKYIISSRTSSSTINWIYILFGLLVVSVFANCWFISNYRKRNRINKQKTTEQLTNQEQNVLDLILEGNTNKEIADTLFVSVSTIKTHVNNLYKKLNVNSRDSLKSLFDK